MAMNIDRHVTAHLDMFNHLVSGDGDSAEKHREFYDEYLAVMDLAAEYYMQTIETVFVRHALPKGEMTHHGRLVDLKAIHKSGLLSVEGERDDISGVGQTCAANDLCVNIPESRKHYHLAKGVGHYGVFNGSRFRNEIAPRIREFIAGIEAGARTGEARQAQWSEALEECLRCAQIVAAIVDRGGRGPKGVRQDARLPTGYGPRLQQPRRPPQVERQRKLGMRRLGRRFVSSGRMAARLEARKAARFRFIAVDREGVVAEPARMGDVINAAAKRTPAPAIENVEDQRRMHGNRRVHRRRRLPGFVAHCADRDAIRGGLGQGQAAAVAGNDVALGIRAGELHLQALGRRIGVARCPADRARFPQHMPRLQRLAQFELDALVLDLAAERESGTRPALRTSRSGKRSHAP